MSTEIRIIEGADLARLLDELSHSTPDRPIKKVTVAFDEGNFKIKVNEGGWTYSLGREPGAWR